MISHAWILAAYHHRPNRRCTFMASEYVQKGTQCSLTPSIPKKTESAPKASTSQSYSTATPLDNTTLPPA